MDAVFPRESPPWWPASLKVPKIKLRPASEASLGQSAGVESL